MREKFLILSMFAISTIHSSPISDCACSREQKPVCANNGREYPTECVFECFQKDAEDKGIKLEIVKSGPCNEVTTMEVDVEEATIDVEETTIDVEETTTGSNDVVSRGLFQKVFRLLFPEYSETTANF